MTSVSVVKILSIRVAVCCVIRVGFRISGIYDDVSNCSRNLLAKSQDSDFNKSILKSPIK